jgi:hypothetical protein
MWFEVRTSWLRGTIYVKLITMCVTSGFGALRKVGWGKFEVLSGFAESNLRWMVLTIHLSVNWISTLQTIINNVYSISPTAVVFISLFKWRKMEGFYKNTYLNLEQWRKRKKTGRVCRSRWRVDQMRSACRKISNGGNQLLLLLADSSSHAAGDESASIPERSTRGSSYCIVFMPTAKLCPYRGRLFNTDNTN